GEGELVLGANDVQSTDIDYDVCFVNRFLGERVINFAAMDSTLLSFWRPMHGTCFKPAYWGGRLLAKGENPKDIDFLFVDLWVHGHNLLLSFASE
ncbi:hypothetical protein Goari_000394, partial [Gossypium aridum]|nr:hypothetical protein [Gossypium aridum]